LIKRVAILLVLASACRAAPGPPVAQHDAPGSGAKSVTDQPGSTWLVTRRPGAVAMDTARLYMAGPLISTAGWTSYVVSYETTVSLADTAALGAQADSVFAHVHDTVNQRPDTTAFMEAHVIPGNRFGDHGGFRFLYHRLPDGSWGRV
jgi:hypothetical protein